MEKVSRRAGGKVSGNQVIRLSGYQEKNKKGNHDIPISRYPDIPISRYLDSPIRYKAGFSLMEMMVVVAIIGIMLAVGIAKFAGSRSQTSIKLAVRSVTSVLRTAHSKAAADKIYCLAVYDTANNRVWVQEGRTYSSKNSVFGTERELPEQVVINLVDNGITGGDPDAHCFTPRGKLDIASAFGAGKIELWDGEHDNTKRTVWIYSAGQIHIENIWR